MEKNMQTLMAKLLGSEDEISEAPSPSGSPSLKKAKAVMILPNPLDGSPGSTVTAVRPERKKPGTKTPSKAAHGSQ